MQRQREEKSLLPSLLPKYPGEEREQAFRKAVENDPVLHEKYTGKNTWGWADSWADSWANRFSLGHVTYLGNNQFAVYQRRRAADLCYYLEIYSYENNEVRHLKEMRFPDYTGIRFIADTLVCSTDSHVVFYKRNEDAPEFFKQDSEQMLRAPNPNYHDDAPLTPVSDTELLYQCNNSACKINVVDKTVTKQKERPVDPIDMLPLARQFRGVRTSIHAIHCVLPELEIALVKSDQRELCAMDLNTLNVVSLAGYLQTLPQEFQEGGVFYGVEDDGTLWFSVTCLDEDGKKSGPIRYFSCDSLLKSFIKDRALALSNNLYEAKTIQGTPIDNLDRDMPKEVINIMTYLSHPQPKEEEFLNYCKEKNRSPRKNLVHVSKFLEDAYFYLVERKGKKLWVEPGDYEARLNNFIQCLVALSTQTALPEEKFPSVPRTFNIFGLFPYNYMSSCRYQEIRDGFNKHITPADVEYFINITLRSRTYPFYQEECPQEANVATKIINRYKAAMEKAQPKVTSSSSQSRRP